MPLIENEKEFGTVVLGALLHDIGKLFQGGRSFRFQTEGRHPEVSASFVRAFSDFFGSVANISWLETIVRHHHQSDAFQGITPRDISDPHLRNLTYLVSTADRLAEREQAEHSPDYQDTSPTSLTSVFQRVFGEHLPGNLKLHPASLTEPEGFNSRWFPAQFEQFVAGEMDGLRTEFISNWTSAISSQAATVNLDTVLSITLDMLHRYTWCIAADSQEEPPDVALFDHLKTTAAIAACLYRYAANQGVLDKQHVQENPGIERFCLVVGDLSGIQDYIFQITAGGDPEGQGTARRLRARSLFIQMLTDVLAHRILHRFDLPMTNLLMLSGGKFYLLLPNLPETEELLRAEIAESGRWLHTHLNGEVAANIAWEIFGDSGFSTDPDTGWDTLIQSINRKLAEAKAHRMQSILVQAASWNEDAFVLGGFEGESVCRSCEHRPRASNSSDDFCQSCSDDLRWGRTLPNARWVAFYHSQSVPGSRDVLGYSVRLCSQERELTGNPYLVLSLNRPPESNQSVNASLRYIANHIPTGEGGDILTFKDMARKLEGRGLVAYLKADVDNLGKAFAFGLRGAATPGRVASMSRQLDLFFTAWVEYRLKTGFTDCYTVFSGGDDLFLVGPWDRILDLVSMLRDDFSKWVAGNPKITFSAGVLITHYRYPLHRASHDVENALDKAKEAPHKDSISLLGYRLKWDEWTHIRARWLELERWVREGRVPMAFLYSLLEYGHMWQRYRRWKEYPEQERERGGMLGLRFQPMLAYNISRNLKRRETPGLYHWAEALTRPQPFTPEQKLELDNLGLLAQLLILRTGRSQQ